MNVAAPPSTLPTSPIAPGAAANNPVTPATDAGTGPRAATEGASPAPFGQVLSRQIDAARKGVRDPHDASEPVRDAQDATEADLGDKAQASTAKSATHDTTTDDAKNQPDDLAHDLASQLALVAQWAGVAKPAAVDPATTPSAPATAAAASGKSLDVQGGIAVVRSAAGNDRDPADPNFRAAGGVERGSADQKPANPATAAAAAATTTATTTTTTTTTATTTTATTIAATTTASTATMQDKATSFSELAAAIAAAAPKADGAGVAPDASTLLVAQDPSLAAATSTIHAPAAAPPAVVVPDRLNEPVGTAAWSHEVGQAALRIAANDLQTASLRLNPEHLGPLDVQVRVNDGIAHIAFQAAHADTRQALEGSRTTLEQMFQGQGLRTGDVSVGTQAGGAFDMARFGAGRGDANASTGNGSGRGGSGGGDAGGSDDGLAVSATVRLARPVGLVDTFA